MWQRGYKLMVGCVDCGYNAHAEALDYDHCPNSGKLGCVARFIECSPATLWAEIQKCEVRCANCHRVKTAERRCLDHA
jgi:hypothetical protein